MLSSAAPPPAISTLAVSTQWPDLASAGLIALCVALVVWAVLDIAGRQVTGSVVEERRRRILREGDATYAALAGVVETLAESRLTERTLIADEELDRLLRLRDDVDVGWTPRQFRGLALAISGAAALFVALFFTVLGFPIPGIVLAAIIAPLIWTTMFLSLKNTVADRQAAIIRRLPFTLDLVALSLQAGLGVERATVEMVASDPIPDALTAELRWISDRLAAGEPLDEVMRRWKRRQRLDEIDDLSLAIIQAHQMGSPLADRLRDQSDRVLTRRWQNVEKASNEAQVRIILPGFLILLACFIAVIVPFFVMVYRQYDATGGF